VEVTKQDNLVEMVVGYDRRKTPVLEEDVQETARAGGRPSIVCGEDLLAIGRDLPDKRDKLIEGKVHTGLEMQEGVLDRTGSEEGIPDAGDEAVGVVEAVGVA